MHSASVLICGARPSGRISIASKYTLKRAEARLRSQVGTLPAFRGSPAVNLLDLEQQFDMLEPQCFQAGSVISVPENGRLGFVLAWL